MMNYCLELYRQMLTSLKRGRSSVGFFKAKPLFIISIFDMVNFIKDGIVYFDKGQTKNFYDTNRNFYAPETKTPYEVPFFHLRTEPFFHLIWENDKIADNINHTPSAKFLREHLLYAKLDDELWNLLQDEDNREYLKQAIINQYLKN